MVVELQALLQVATKLEVRVGFNLNFFKGAAVGSLAGQLAERGVNHFIEDREVRSDLGSLADLAENPARELVKSCKMSQMWHLLFLG